VWVNGFPDSGKLTVTRVLTELLGKEELILIDKHQLIDPVEAKIPRDHPDYLKERQLQRSIAFTEYVDSAAMRSRTIIFTGRLSLSVLIVPSSLGDHRLRFSVKL
jgi:hypothetical protein